MNERILRIEDHKGRTVRKTVSPLSPGGRPSSARANASARLRVLPSTGTTSTVRTVSTVRTLVSTASSVSPSLRWQRSRADRAVIAVDFWARYAGGVFVEHVPRYEARVGTSSSAGIWLAPGGHPQPQAGFGAGATTIVRVNHPGRVVKGVSRIGGPTDGSGSEARSALFSPGVAWCMRC